MNENKSISVVNTEDPNFYVHNGDTPYYAIQEESVGDEHLYDNTKNRHELQARQKTEAELLQEEEQLLEDFFLTATKEFSKFDSVLLKQKNKISHQDYNKFLEERERILCSIRDLNHVLGRVRHKKGGYAYTKWDQFVGFNQKVQHEGQKYGLSIDGFSALEYIDEKNNNFYQVNYFNKVDESQDLQLVPMVWHRHATFMILDHTNHKIIIYDPNGDFKNLCKEQAGLDKNQINKDNVMKFLLGKDNAEKLKDYDLCDANGAWSKKTWIQGLCYYRHLNTGKQKLKAGETDGACAFSSRHFADIFLKEYFKHIKRNKTKAIEDYGAFLHCLNIKMKKNGLYHSANLRNILKAGLENFYRCNIIKESLFNKNNKTSLHTGLTNHFPKTIAKFQHLIEHYKYREHNSKVHHWEDAVQRVQQMRRDEVLERKAKKLAPTRKIMNEGFEETYGYSNNEYRNDGCEYLNAMKKNPIHYKQDTRTHYPENRQLLELKVDAYGNDLNRSEIKNNLSKKINRNQIIKRRRGNLNLDELPGRTKMSPNLSII